MIYNTHLPAESKHQACILRQTYKTFPDKQKVLKAQEKVSGNKSETATGAF